MTMAEHQLSDIWLRNENTRFREAKDASHSDTLSFPLLGGGDNIQMHAVYGTIIMEIIVSFLEE